MKARRIAAAMTTLLLLGGATACSTASPGDAAVVGDTRISESEIGAQMASLNEAVGQPVDTPSPELARTLVSYNVGYALIGATADALAVKVPPSQLDLVYGQQLEQVGGEEALRQAAAQQGVPPVNLRRDLETQLLATAIVQKVAPGGDPAAGQQLLIDEVRKVAESVDVEVAPKYGVWDNEMLQIVPDPDPVSRSPEQPAPALPMP